MEGVVLITGTGPLARLDGWTTAGKTGSAQKIDPNTGRYSPTNFIASFTGFAPVNNPAVTILVSLDSPIGLHEGGQVSAPVFKRIAEQVLPYLDVPRDVPLNQRLIQAAYKKQEAIDESTLEESSATDFNAQLDETPAEVVPAKTAPEPVKRPSEVMMAVEDGSGCDGAGFCGEDDAGSDVDVPAFGARSGFWWQQSCSGPIAGRGNAGEERIAGDGAVWDAAAVEGWQGRERRKVTQGGAALDFFEVDSKWSTGEPADVGRERN